MIRTCANRWNRERSQMLLLGCTKRALNRLLPLFLRRIHIIGDLQVYYLKRKFASFCNNNAILSHFTFETKNSGLVHT